MTHQHDGGLTYHELVKEALLANESFGSPGSVRGLKYAVLAVAQAINDLYKEAVDERQVKTADAIGTHRG